MCARWARVLFQRDFSSGFFHFISIIYFQFELRHKRTAYFHPSDVIIFNGRPSNADRCTSYFCRILCTCNHYRFTVLSIRNSNIEYSMHMRQTVPLFPTAPPDTKKHTQRKKVQRTRATQLQFTLSFASRSVDRFVLAFVFRIHRNDIFSVVCCRSFHFAQVPKSISLASCLPHLLFLFNFVFLADAVAGSDAVVVVVGLFFVGSFVNRSFMCIAADVSFFSSINDCLIVSLFFFISISVIQSGYMSLWFDVSVLSLSLSLYAGNNSFLASRLFWMQA